MRTGRLVRVWRSVVAAVVAGVALAAVPAVAEPSHGTAFEVPVEHDKVMRSYRLFVPRSLPTGRQVPLVLVLHGLNGETGSFAALSKMDEAASRHGFLVAYPTGLSRSWNAGTCCGESAEADVDDVGFLAEVVEDVSRGLLVDRSRVYAAGFSNGGMMALRAACDRPDVFAAVASVMGTLQAPCERARPVSVLLVAGGRDHLVPYRGVRWSSPLETELTPVTVAAGTFERANACSGLPERTWTARAEIRSYTRCAGGSSTRVVLLPGSGHGWPGADRDGWHAPDEVWRFLSAHASSARPAPGSTPVLETRVAASRRGHYVTGFLDGRFDLVIGQRLVVETFRGRWLPAGSVVTDVEGRFRFMARRGVLTRVRYAGTPGLRSQAVVA